MYHIAMPQCNGGLQPTPAAAATAIVCGDPRPVGVWACVVRARLQGGSAASARRRRAHGALQRALLVFRTRWCLHVCWFVQSAWRCKTAQVQADVIPSISDARGASLLGQGLPLGEGRAPAHGPCRLSLPPSGCRIGSKQGTGGGAFASSQLFAWSFSAPTWECAVHLCCAPSQAYHCLPLRIRVDCTGTTCGVQPRHRTTVCCWGCEGTAAHVVICCASHPPPERSVARTAGMLQSKLMLLSHLHARFGIRAHQRSSGAHVRHLSCLQGHVIVTL